MQIAVPRSGGAALPARGQWEQVTGCWLLTSRMAFENVGFSTLVDDLRLLTCADCEQEVVGIQQGGERFFLPHSRLLWHDGQAAALKARHPRQELSASVLRQLGLRPH